MQPFLPLVYVALIYSAALSLAAPVMSSLIVARSQSCNNSPNTIAGTVFNRRTQIFGTPVRPTPKNIIWCLLGTPLYIKLDFTGMAATAVGSIRLLLLNTIHVCDQHLAGPGDGVIQSGRVFTSAMNGLSLELTNANNHQLTWGVAGAAVRTMLDYMQSQDIYGQATMFIYDGLNVVGQGVLQYNPQGALGGIERA